MTTLVRQGDGSALARYNCTAAAGAMLVQAGTGGAQRPSAATMRALSTKPKSREGLTLGDLDPAFEHFGLKLNHRIVSTATLGKMIDARTPMVLQGSYGRLPVKYRALPSFTSGHALYLEGTTVYDPLGTGPIQIPRAELLAFAAAFTIAGARVGTVAGAAATVPTGSTIGQDTTGEKVPVVLAFGSLLRSWAAAWPKGTATIFDTTRQGRNGWAGYIIESRGQEKTPGQPSVLLADLLAASAPYLGKPVSALPDTLTVTLDVKPTPGPLDSIFPVSELVAGLTDAIGRGLLLLLIVGGLLLGVWLLFREGSPVKAAA